MELGRQRELLRRVAGRILTRGLAMAWVAWREAAAQRKRPLTLTLTITLTPTLALALTLTLTLTLTQELDECRAFELLRDLAAQIEHALRQPLEASLHLVRVRVRVRVRVSPNPNPNPNA